MRPVAAAPVPHMGKGAKGGYMTEKGFGGKGMEGKAGGYGKGKGGRGLPPLISQPPQSGGAHNYAEAINRPVTPPTTPQKVVAPANPHVAGSSVASSSAQFPKAGPGNGGKGGGKGKGNASKTPVCYTCHLQGRDWKHDYRTCDFHQKFEGWKFQVINGINPT